MTNPTETLTVERLDEMEDIARAATPGPWFSTHHNEVPGIYAKPEHQSLCYGIAKTTTITLQGASPSPGPANAAHIVATNPATAPKVYALAREGLAGRAEIARLRVTNEGLREIQMRAEAELAAARDMIEALKASERALNSNLASCVERRDHWYSAATKAEAVLSTAQAITRGMAQHADELDARADAAEARVRGLEEALRHYADVFCEGFENGCGLHDELNCSGCRAYRALIPPTEPAPVVNQSLTTAEPGEGDHHGG